VKTSAAAKPVFGAPDTPETCPMTSHVGFAGPFPRRNTIGIDGPTRVVVSLAPFASSKAEMSASAIRAS